MIKLPPIRMDRRARFEKYAASNAAFDYYGMERGGHFAILAWLLNMAGKPSMYVVNTKTTIPIPQFYHPSGWHSAEKAPKLMGLGYGPDPDLEALFSRIDSRKVIVAIRDIRNCIASRLKWQDVRAGSPFRIDTVPIKLWIAYAKQALGEKDYFNGHCITIKFDLWAKNEKYRKQLQEQLVSKFKWALDFEIGEDQVKEVSKLGGGSSFDQLEYKGKAHKMKVTERWKKFKNDERYKRLMTDEVLRLNERLIKE